MLTLKKIKYIKTKLFALFRQNKPEIYILFKCP